MKSRFLRVYDSFVFLLKPSLPFYFRQQADIPRVGPANWRDQGRARGICKTVVHPFLLKISIGLTFLISLALSFEIKAQTNMVPDADEFQVLKDIYDSLGGNGWQKNKNWPTPGNWPATATSSEFGTWFGVTVTNGDIKTINLSSNLLTGKIPRSIGKATQLIKLYLNKNQLSGSLSAAIGNLANLELINVSENQLSGSIPSSFSGLTKLWYFSVRDNQLTGQLPSLANWALISQIYIYGNQLSGAIPADIGNCSALTILNGHDNLFTSLPSSLLNLPAIVTIHFENNEINAIPDFGAQVNKTNLTLNLKNNRLDFGQIETFAGKGLKQVTYSQQKLFNEITYIKLAPGNELVITSRDAGVNGSYTWYFQADGTTGWVIVNSQNQDGTQKTFKRSVVEQSHAGLYRYMMTNSTLSGFIESVPIVVRIGSDVIWNEMEGVQETNSIITKTAAAGWGNAKSASENALLANTDGWFEFVIDQNTTANNYAVGFTQSSDNSRASLEYGVGIDNLNGQKLFIHEANENGTELGTWALGDVIRIQRTGSTIKYYKNGFEIRSVSADASKEYKIKILPYAGKVPAFTTSFWLHPSRGTVPDALEFAVLRDIYDTMGGNSWVNKTNWPAASNGVINITAAQMDTWYGVGTENGDITVLNLLQNNLGGFIPAAISKLTSLKIIDFRINHIGGDLPSTLTSMINLKELRLYDNLFTGSIPADIGNLINLEALVLAKNNFTGTVPESIGNLTKVSWLSLYRISGLTGPLPQSFYNLVNLRELYIYDTQIEGKLLPEIGNFTKLVHFWGYRNKWSGTLPASLGNISTLLNLYLYNNNFSGVIPENFKKLTNLKNLWLYANQLSGDVPPWLAELQGLTTLAIGSNNLTGSIPKSFGNLTNLTGLYLNNLNITGQIPDELQNLNKLTAIDLKFTGLEGPIPNWFVQKTKLKEFIFNDSKFTSLPDFTSRTDKSSLKLYVQNNKIPLADIEKNFTAANSHGLQTFIYSPQQNLFTPAAAPAPLQGELKIQAPYGGVHGVYNWEKLIDGNWANVNSQNQSARPEEFIINPATSEHTGFYRYTVTNSWVPGISFQHGPIEASVTDQLNNTPVAPSYIGLIASMRWRTEKPFAVSGEEFRGMYLYTYDEKYQIKDATWAGYNLTTSWASATNQYRLTGMDYDPNGNIKKLKRYSQVGVPTHNFDYQYNTVADAKKTNQLESIPGYSNYKYNSLGQMTEEYKDAGDEQFVEYDVTGKVSKVYAFKNTSTGNFDSLKVEFIYDDRGFRLAKKNYAKVNGTDAVQRTTWYIRDASGNVISIYEEDNIDSILTETEVPIYGSGKIGTYYPAQNGSSVYEITDHLGNVRALVRDNVSVYTATMEDDETTEIDNPRVEEMLYFENLFETEVTDSRMNHTKPGGVVSPDKAAYLYWVDGMNGTEAADKAVGPAIALKVNKGDKLDIETWARYERKVSYTKNFSLATLASFLGGSFAYTGGFEGSTLSQATQNLSSALTAAAYPDDGSDDTRPFAYLNYIVYDKDMVYKNAGWLRVTDDGAGFNPGEEALQDDHEHLKLNTVSIGEDGFIYVWVSNQSEATKVWFDDLTVTHTGTILTQATDYGVWGDILREQKTDLSTYRFGYQGQFSEKDLETGWNHFELREYDPMIGRWLVPDPAGQYFSPYEAFGNNPISRVDPDGGTDGDPGDDNPFNWGSTPESRQFQLYLAHLRARATPEPGVLSSMWTATKDFGSNIGGLVTGETWVKIWNSYKRDFEMVTNPNPYKEEILRQSAEITRYFTFDASSSEYAYALTYGTLSYGSMAIAPEIAGSVGRFLPRVELLSNVGFKTIWRSNISNTGQYWSGFQVGGNKGFRFQFHKHRIMGSSDYLPHINVGMGGRYHIMLNSSGAKHVGGWFYRGKSGS